MARLMWVLAVSGLITMRSAISSLDSPYATSATVSRSQLISSFHPVAVPVGNGSLTYRLISLRVR